VSDQTEDDDGALAALAIGVVVLIVLAGQAVRHRVRSHRSDLPRVDRTVMRNLRRAQRRDDLAIGLVGKVALAG